MRILPGTPQGFANETVTTRHLGTYMVNHPEILPSVMGMFDKDFTAFSSLLTKRNMYQGDLAINPNNKGYRVVGSRKVMWNIKGSPDRKITFVKDAECINATYPGQYQTVIRIFCNSNFIAPKEVIGLADDHNTQLYAASDRLPEEVEQGVFAYDCKINTNNREAYVNPKLLKAGMECNVLYNQYEELSETAYEKYTFDEMAYTYMTIQRMKCSISGSAEELKASAVWVEHNGVNMWETKAKMEMYARAAQYRENQMMFGKSTVDAAGKVIMKTHEGFEVCAGDGALNQGDGTWRLPYNDFSLNVLDGIMSNVGLYSNSDGMPEVAVICGRTFGGNFQKAMKKEAGVDPRVVEGSGSEKGINTDYAYYIHNGVKFTPTIVPWFDSPTRASVIGADGIRNSSKRAIFCSLGNVNINQPTVELLALGKRNWLEGEINGINKGGQMANSVDGKSDHVLFETGIAVRATDALAELYCPFV